MDNEMSQVTKVLLAFGGVMVVGFIIVGTTRESPTDKKLEAQYMQSTMLSKLAQDKCSQAIYAQTQDRVYTPNSTTGDQVSYVQFTWRGNGTVKEAECRYEQEKGIALLKVNGETLSVQALGESQSGAATSRSSAAAGGGHGSSATPGAHR